MANISTKNIAQALYEATYEKSGKELEEVISGAMKFLSEKRLLGKSKEILNNLEILIDKREGITRAVVTSKEKLRKSERDEIEELLRKRYKVKDVLMSEVEDKNILGGIKIEVGDEVVDLSLRSSMNQLQNYLLNV